MQYSPRLKFKINVIQSSAKILIIIYNVCFYNEIHAGFCKSLFILIQTNKWYEKFNTFRFSNIVYKFFVCQRWTVNDVLRVASISTARYQVNHQSLDYKLHQINRTTCFKWIHFTFSVSLKSSCSWRIIIATPHHMQPSALNNDPFYEYFPFSKKCFLSLSCLFRSFSPGWSIMRYQIFMQKSTCCVLKIFRRRA